MNTSPDSSLRHVMYRSRAIDGEISHEMLVAIRESAVRNNLELGITGFLMCEGDSFLQLIEGPPEAIEKTFFRIQGDRRHTSIEVLVDEACDERSVPAWAMGVFTAEDGGSVIDHALGHPTLHPRVRETLESVRREAA